MIKKVPASNQQINLEARLKVVRDPKRIPSSILINGVFDKDSLVYYKSPDPSLIAAKGKIDGIECVVLGQERPNTVNPSESLYSMTPAGYSYALQRLDEAEKAAMPVITFIDTVGADASMKAEKGGQALLIADCIKRYCDIKAPVISVIHGFGGSGGALAMQGHDRVFMLENAMESVISPESAIRITMNRELAAGTPMSELIPLALDMLHPEAEHLKEIGMVDYILPEPKNGANKGYREVIKTVRDAISATLSEWTYKDSKTGERGLTRRKIDQIVRDRYRRIMDYGKFEGRVVGSLHDFWTRFRKREPKEYMQDLTFVDVNEANLKISKEEFQKRKEKGTKGLGVMCERVEAEEKTTFPPSGGCGTISDEKWIQNFYACPTCGKGEYLAMEEQIRKILDEGSFAETERNLTLNNIKDTKRYSGNKYKSVLKKAEENSFSKEALVTGTGTIDGREVVVAISDIQFIGGSFGAVFGEKFRRASELAYRKRVPLVSVTSSGGARMYEGPMALAQMAKMIASLLPLKQKGISYLSVLADPCTGGAYASYASVGGIIIGEKGSLAAFAGPRVTMGAGIEVDPATITTDMLYKNGRIHHLVNRKDVKEVLSFHVEYFYNHKYPSQRKNTGRMPVIRQ